MNNIYGAIFTLLGSMTVVALFTLLRWVLDVNMTGWRLRRWEERCNSMAFREWKPWFAWRPVRTVDGDVVWWTRIYRRVGNSYVDHDGWTWYYYGTVFEALKDKCD